MPGPWERYGQNPASNYTVGTVNPRVAAQERRAEEDQSFQRASAARAAETAARTAAAAERTAGVQERQLGNQQFDNLSNLRKEFTSLKPVQEFTTILPQVATAMRIAKNPAATGADDLSLIYTFGKVMDPGSVVREGELALASQTGSFADSLEGAAKKVLSGERLPDGVRRNLVESMRRRGIEMSRLYNLQRHDYQDRAKRFGFNPIDVVGEHPATPYQQAEADFTGHTIGNLDGSIGTRPAGYGANTSPTDPGTLIFNDQMPEKSANSYRFTPEQETQLQAAARTGASAATLQALAKDFGGNLSPENASKVAEFYAKPENRDKVAGFDYSKVDEVKPVDPGDGGGGAFVRGVANAGSLGLVNRLGAVADTIRNDGTTYGENLDRRRGYDAFDEQNQALPRLGGQFVGGLALPVIGGDASAAGLARTGAAYGGAAGFNNSYGDAGDRLVAAGSNAVAGGALGYGAGRLGQVIASRTPPPGAYPRGVNGDLVEAAERQGFEGVSPDFNPGKRSTYAFLEALPFSGGRVRGDLARGAGQLEQRVQDVGGGVAVPRMTAGETVRDAGRAYTDRSRTVVNRLYDRAAQLGGNAQVTPRQALATVDQHIADLSGTPNANRTKLGVLEQFRGDLVDDAGNVRDLSVQQIRDLRTAMRDELGTKGLRFSDTERRITQAIDSASADIQTQLQGPALRAYQRADRAFRERADIVDNVIEHFIGADRANPKSGEQVMGAIENAARPRAGDATKLSRLAERLSPDERRTVASTIAGQLGRRTEDGEGAFTPNLFFSQIKNYSPEARTAIFGRQGAADLADLAQLSEARAGTLGMLNNSRSGQVSNWLQAVKTVLSGGGAGAGVGAAFGGVGGLATGSTVGMVAAPAALGGAYLSARSMGNPRVVTALAMAARARTPQAQAQAVARFTSLAAREPTIANDLLPIRDALQAALPRVAADEKKQDNRQ